MHTHTRARARACTRTQALLQKGALLLQPLLDSEARLIDRIKLLSGWGSQRTQEVKCVGQAGPGRLHCRRGAVLGGKACV